MERLMLDMKKKYKAYVIVCLAIFVVYIGYYLHMMGGVLVPQNLVADDGSLTYNFFPIVENSIYLLLIWVFVLILFLVIPPLASKCREILQRFLQKKWDHREKIRRICIFLSIVNGLIYALLIFILITYSMIYLGSLGIEGLEGLMISITSFVLAIIAAFPLWMYLLVKIPFLNKIGTKLYIYGIAINMIYIAFGIIFVVMKVYAEGLLIMH